MANIWDFVQFNPSERPKYTRYELSKMVREKREEIGLDIDEISQKYDVSNTLWQSIEDASRAFNANIYKLISSFLDMSMEEILSKDKDDMSLISFRSQEINEQIEETIKVANFIFDEMVMQEKISTH